MMMSFTELERQALGSIADGLAGSDPRLASMLTIFSPAGRRRGDAGTREDPGAAQVAGRSAAKLARPVGPRLR
jgi:hypothetical protein